jgi:hypothetical protein
MNSDQETVSGPNTAAAKTIRDTPAKCVDQTDATAIENILEKVVAPLLVAFVAEMLEQAKRDQVERLYFVARDGYILKLIAEQLEPSGLELRYLYGSRQAWLLPSVADEPEAALQWAVLRGQPTSPAAILRRVAISYESFVDLDPPAILRDSFHQEIQGRDLSLLETFLTKPEVLARIAANARRERETTLGYFRQEGLFDKTPWALVDIGWTGRCQAALRKLLRSVQPDREVHGYYLGVNHYPEPREVAGPMWGWQRDNLFASPEHPTRVLFRNQGAIEEVFTMAAHGTTLSYEKTASGFQPRLKEESANDLKKRFTTQQQTICRAFAQRWQRNRRRGDAERLKETSLANLARFFLHPTRREVDALKWLQIGADQNEAGKLPLARAYAWGTLLHEIRQRFQPDRSHRHSRWLEGSLALSPPSLRFVLQNFLRLARRRRV